MPPPIFVNSMGKTSRRRAPAAPGPVAVVDAATPSAAPADGAEPHKPASMVEALFAIDRWEQVVLMFLCVSVTMNLLGNYIPGLQVLMESEVVGCARSPPPRPHSLYMTVCRVSAPARPAACV